MSDEEKREKRYISITTGKLYPLLVKMAIPSMIGMIVSTVYSMTDTFWVGKLDDETYTASVGIVFAFVSVIQAIGFWFGYGSGNYISRMLGKKEIKEAERMAGCGVLIALISGVGLLIAGLVFLKPLAVLLGGGSTEKLLAAVMGYLRITVCTIPFMLLSNVIYNQLRLAGSAANSMIGLLVGMAVNMILDPLFILKCGMGVEGAAYASLAGQISGLVILYRETTQHGNVRISLKEAKPDGVHIKEILAGGAPNFARQGLSSISSLIFNNVASGFGVTAIAALTIALRVAYMAYALVIGFGQGFQPVCALNYGAGNTGRIRKAFILTWLTVSSFLIISALVLYLNAGEFIGLFTQQPEVAQLAVKMVRAQCLVLPFMGYYILIGMLLQNIGRFGLATCVTTAENGTVFIPVLYICIRLMGENALIWCKPVASLIALILSLFIGTYAWKKYLNSSQEAQQ
ncbi:MAG: MATE family efflux transporter [Lachnospiraceae bacterium]|nr:MATE family efflux transporter [Lachnospiraceae bacterium]